MKRLFLAAAGAITLFAAPAGAQSQNDLPTECNQAAFADCSRECGRRNLSDSAYAGCVVGCGIASGCN